MDDWEKLSTSGEETDNQNWHSTDEFHDVYASLLLLKKSLELVKKEPTFWKWAILSAHSALQSACVCILTRTDGGGALDKSSEKKLHEYHSLSSQKAVNEANETEWILGDPVYPETRISNLPELLKKLPTDIKVVIPKNVRSEDDRLIKDLSMLHGFRNKFTHFESLGWSLEIEGLPRIIGEALSLTEQIVKSGKYTRYNRFQDLNIQPHFTAIKQILSELQTD